MNAMQYQMSPMEQREMTDMMNQQMDYLDKMERMYPAFYRRIYPCVQSAVDVMPVNVIGNMTDEMLNQMVRDLLLQCNVHNDMPRGHNMQSMEDVIKLLLIREITEKIMSEEAAPAFAPYFPLWPFFLFPFGHPRHHHRRWGGWGW